ncbi:MAG: adenylate kinase [Gammaproteobacteria bacterium]|nr:adenylate kinase [Gammaproteobacteria bacterium]
MKIILLGCPGAGKGTQAQFICEKLNIPFISTGDMLRSAIKAKTELGLKVKKIIDDGYLVPDDIMIDLLKHRISAPDCQRGFLLDGFPRTLPQAEALRNANIPIDYVITIQVHDDIVVKRLTGRRVHPASGRAYHIEFNPPKVSDKDDETGEPLIHRDDDKEDVIRNRLRVYHNQTQPLIKYYENLHLKNIKDAPKFFKIDGEKSIEEIKEKIFKILNVDS